jgi:hypothetical protein
VGVEVLVAVGVAVFVGVAVAPPGPEHSATSSRLKFTFCSVVVDMKRTVCEPPSAKALAFTLMSV